MPRHFGNLKRLHSKLIARYGADDDLVLQVTEELKLLQAVESKHTFGCTIPATLSKNADLAISPST